MDTPAEPFLALRDDVVLPLAEVSWQAIRAQGAGGQNVNKVASAIHLRFDIHASSLPQSYKDRLLTRRDRRLSTDGVFVIKAQRFRTRERNLEDGLERLRQFIVTSTEPRTPRKATRVSARANQRRLDAKIHRASIKRLRQTPSD